MFITMVKLFGSLFGLRSRRHDDNVQTTKYSWKTSTTNKCKVAAKAALGRAFCKWLGLGRSTILAILACLCNFFWKNTWQTVLWFVVCTVANFPFAIKHGELRLPVTSHWWVHFHPFFPNQMSGLLCALHFCIPPHHFGCFDFFLWRNMLADRFVLHALMFRSAEHDKILFCAFLLHGTHHRVCFPRASDCFIPSSFLMVACAVSKLGEHYALAFSWK